MARFTSADFEDKSSKKRFSASDFEGDKPLSAAPKDAIRQTDRREVMAKKAKASVESSNTVGNTSEKLGAFKSSASVNTAPIGNTASFSKNVLSNNEVTKNGVQEFIFEQGLKNLNDKYKDINTVARAYSPEYQADIKSLAQSAGYDTAPKERNKMFDPEATKKTLPYLGEKSKMGLVDFAAGLNQLKEVGKLDEKAKTLSPVQMMQLQQDMDKAEFQKAEQENVSPGLQKVGNVAQATAAMIPNIILSAANPAMGLAQVGMSAAGNSAQEAMKDNATKGQALAYGGLVGGIEAGTEKLFGVLPFMKGIGDKATSKLISPIKNKILKSGVKWIAGMGGEAIEEGIAGVLDPFAKRLTYDKDAPMASFAEISEQMLMGAAVAGILGVPGTVADTTGKQVPTIQDIKSVNNDIITFNMADGSTLELDTTQMRYEDIETIESAVPADTKSDAMNKAKKAIENGKNEAIKRNEATVGTMNHAEESTQSPKAEATILAEANKPAPVKTIDDHIRDAQNKVDDLRYQRNELGIDTTSEIETAENELLGLQKKKYLPYYKEQLTLLEKTQKELFAQTNDISPEFIQMQNSIDTLRQRVGEIEGVNEVKQPIAEQAKVEKAEQTTQADVEIPAVKTQTVSAPTDTGKVITPKTVETAPVTSKTQTEVSTYNEGDTVTINDNGTKREVEIVEIDGDTVIAESNGTPKQYVKSELDGMVAQGKEKVAQEDTQISNKGITATRPTGNETTMKTNDGTDIKAKYAVVSADELVTSHNTDMTQNKDYPQELQPRQRERAASILEVEKMSKNIQPELLGENIKVSDGAPIIGDDGVVESGNGRVIALKKMYENANDANYQKWPEDNKAKFGIEGDLPDNPVLVRVRTTEVDRPTFAKQANESSVAAMSATETAKSDAEKMSDDIITLFAPNDEGTINTADNKTFVQRFLNEVVPSNEHAKYVTKDGLLSQDGYNRIRNALFYKAYGNTNLVDSLTEDLDSNLKNVIKAMVANAPKISAIKDGIQSGTLHNLDFADDIVYAATKAMELKKSGTKVDEFVNQVSLFGGPSNVQKEMLQSFDKNNRSAKRINAFIRFITEGVENAGNPNQIDMFSGKTPTKDDIIEHALRRVNNEIEGTVEGQTALPISETGYGSGAETGRNTKAEGTAESRKVSEPTKAKPDRADGSKTVPDQFKGAEPGDIDYKPVQVGMQTQIVNTKGENAQADKFEYEDSELETIHKRNKGVHKDTFMERTKQAITDIKNMFTRPIGTLPYTPEFSNLYYDLIKLPMLSKRAADDTTRTLEAIIGKLSKDEFNMFERKVFLDDLAEEIRLGNTLPNKWTEDKVNSELQRLDQYMTDKTKKAVDKRKAFMDNLVEEFIKAKALVGVNVSNTFTRENYFRHQVLDYMEAKDRIRGAGKRLQTPTKEGFTRARSGEYAGDINTDYLQAEFEVMAQMKTNILICETMDRIDTGYNVADTIKANAEAEGLDNWHDAIPEGYRAWQPIPGNVFYMSQPIGAELVAESLALRGLKLDDIKDPKLKVAFEDIMNDLAKQTSLLVVGSKRAEWVVKNEVADTLDNLNRVAPTHILSRLSKKIQNSWKRWVTSLNPKSTIKFGIRNFSGDFEAVIQGNAGAIKKMPKAIAELREAIVNGHFTPEMKAWYDEGGYQSLMYPQEISEVNKLKPFEKFRDTTVGEKITKPFRAYSELTEDMHNFREAVLRYSVFLDFLEQLNDGKLKNYGASKPKLIDALTGNERKAFKLANDLLGAYDEVSEAGKWIRSHLVPFYSWMEINFGRNTQLIKNAFTNPEVSAAQKAGMSAGLAAKLGAKTLWKVSKLFLVTAALAAWNQLKFPDMEEELPEDVRVRPHIIFGRDKDGNVLYFSRLGALNDFLEWFGLDSAPQDVKDILNGKMTITEYLVDTVKAPINKAVGGVSPFMKTIPEIATGKSLYPDVFDPKFIRDRTQYIAQSLGLRDEYDVLAGKPHRPYFNNLDKALLYKADPKESAYYSILDKKSNYKKKKGEESGSFFYTKKSNALYNYKLALRYGDEKAQEKYLKQYESYGVNSAQTIDGVLTMSPYYGIKRDEREAFKTSLTGKDKERLELAEQYFMELLETELTSKRPLTDGTKAMLEIYKKTGETKQFPKVVSGEMTYNNKKYKLSNEEIVEYQSRVDKAMYKRADELANSESFQKQDPEKQAELMSNALNQQVALERTRWKREKYK